MKPERKYLILITVITCSFLYLLFTEMPTRLSTIWSLYDEYRAKQIMILDPQALAEKKLALMKVRKTLTSSIVRNSSRYEQNQSGVIEYLNGCARESGFSFASFVPITIESTGQIEEIGFKLKMIVPYHLFGKFVNTVEKGEMIARIKAFTIKKVQSTSPQLDISCEGSVFVLREQK
jgi:Tfp pilus assembly protein PilO